MAAKAAGTNRKYVELAQKAKEENPAAFQQMKDGTASVGAVRKIIQAPPPRKKPENEKDSIGRPIHPKARDAIVNGPAALDELARKVHALKREILALPDDGLGRKINRQTVESAARDIVNNLKFGKPFTSCPMGDKCKETCKLCNGTQWITSDQWDNVPSDLK